MQTRKPYVMVHLDPQAHAALKARAAKDLRSVANFVRNLIEKELTKETAK